MMGILCIFVYSIGNRSGCARLVAMSCARVRLRTMGTARLRLPPCPPVAKSGSVMDHSLSVSRVVYAFHPSTTSRAVGHLSFTASWPAAVIKSDGCWIIED